MTTTSMTPTPTPTLGEAIRARREQLGLTQREVARRAGISVQVVQGLEVGRHARPRNPDGLAEALELGRWYTPLAEAIEAAIAEGRPLPHEHEIY